MRRVRMEYTSRGARVPACRLLRDRPAVPGRGCILVPMARGAGGGFDRTEGPAGWAGHLGEHAAVLMVDLPLHGERGSPERSERITAGRDRGRFPSALGRSLGVDFTRHAAAALAADPMWRVRRKSVTKT